MVISWLQFADIYMELTYNMLRPRKVASKSMFLDLAIAKSLQSTRTVTDAADDADVLTTTGYTC